MQVKELMSTEVFTCRPEDSLARAAQLMWDADIGAVPVLDAEGHVAGMLTDRDICMAAYTQGCSLEARTVDSVMSKQVQTCAPTDSVALAEEVMRRHQVRRLPVTSDGHMVGILSLNDLALAAVHRKTPKGDQVSLEGVATTLARICEHRRVSAVAAQ